MSSSITSLVTVLDGTNYQDWSSRMQSYLMHQGLWKTTKENAVCPAEIKTEDGTANSNQDQINEWFDESEKALGAIRLRLATSLGHQYNDVESPSKLWLALKTKYGAPGVPTAFLEFKGLMDTVIPNGSDPSPAIDKILAHHTRLAKMDWVLAGEFVAMILLAKAPAYMESTVQVALMSMKAEKNKDGTTKKPDLNGIVTLMIQAWETSRRQGAGRQNQNNQQQRANKLSAVK